MKFIKKAIDTLPKCYSIAPMRREGKLQFLVAAEKHDPCRLYDEDGKCLETVWTEPGGVMTMAQIPGREDQFLATHQFYSPNDSAQAKIVLATRRGSADWAVRTLVDAPFVHRFGLLERNGTVYLLVCCLKSGHGYKDDWSKPGRVYAAVLPPDLTPYREENQLPLTLLREGMTHNHGYSAYLDHGIQTGLVTCDEGVFQFIPPEAPAGAWIVNQLHDQPVSDAVLLDFDGDGEPELGCIAPFHGDRLYICHKNGAGVYEKVWEHPEPMEMLHASWPCRIKGKPVWLVGHRKGARDLLMVFYENGAWKTEAIDHDCGSANVFHFVNSRGEDILVSANRETDEIAIYTIGQ